MQERYLGDSHDFLKYALLRHLSGELGLRLGVDWYLTRPESVDCPGNNDGEKRQHLKGGERLVMSEAMAVSHSGLASMGTSESMSNQVTILVCVGKSIG